MRIEFGEMRLFVSWVGWHDVTEISLFAALNASARAQGYQKGDQRGARQSSQQPSST